MKMPAELQPALMGAVAGAIALAILGFTWGGWVTGGTAETMSKAKASSAVVAALAPICVENFKRDKDASTQLIALKKANSWEQGSFIEKGGWAMMPGTKSVDSAMTRACADLIIAEKT